MLASLADLVVRQRRRVLIATVAFVALAGVLGGGVADRLTTGGFDDPAAESTRGNTMLRDQFGAGAPNLVLLVTANGRGTTVDTASVRAAGLALTTELAATEHVGQVASYWSLGNAAPLRSSDAREALVLARILGNDDEVDERVAGISKTFDRRATSVDSTVSVAVGGEAAVFREVGSIIESDLARAEGVTLPVTFLMLVLIFGSLVAGLLPIGVGVVAIFGTFLVLRVVSTLTDVSVYSLNLATALGLGLAIDYSLFIVSRYREELAAGHQLDVAIRRTLQTAGRTVVFSALTVAVSLAALLVFPFVFLRSFAYAGIPVVALAAAGAVIALPAVLAVLGPRLDKGRIPWARRLSRANRAGDEHGFWHRVAVAVMRRPIPFLGVVLVLLLALGSPFTHLRLGLPDDRVLPTSASARKVSDLIRQNFVSREAAALAITVPALPASPERDGQVDVYAKSISKIEGVARVDALTGSYVKGFRVLAPGGPITARFENESGTWLSVVPAGEPISRAGERLVEAVRAMPAPFERLVSGPSAWHVDMKASLYSRLPIAIGLIGLVTLVVMFLMVGSVLVPIKAFVLNLLSLTATFGAMVWIFQDGHLSGALGFTATGSLTATMPILMFCIAFGLSMDYEVFLLSRIKEEHDRGATNEVAVARGLERTGKIVTAAALTLATVFLAMATSGISFMKMFGVGLALAIVMDATLVRGVLVPAFMRLAGNANWWAPAPLRRLYERAGWGEVELPETDASGGTDQSATAEESPGRIGSGPGSGSSRPDPVPSGA